LYRRTVCTLMTMPLEMRRQEMIRKAQELVLQSTKWLSFSDIVARSGQNSRDVETSPNRWTASKRIFAIPLNGVDHFPAYGLHEVAHGNVRAFEPKPIMASLVAALGDDYSSWQLAAWFGSANGYLHGTRPMDLLDSDPARVLDAAKFAAHGIQHG